VGAAVIGLLGLFLGGLMLNQCLKFVRDALGGAVQQVEGPVRKSVVSSGRSTTYYYHAGREKFTVSRSAYAALVPNLTYRLYYAPRSRRIVAVEATRT